MQFLCISPYTHRYMGRDSKIDDAQLAELAQLATQAAYDAGELIQQFRSSPELRPKHKADSSLVTAADLEAEKLIVGHIRNKFPEHRILSEENFQKLPPGGSYLDPLWVIDPIDGTTNFVHGQSHVAVSIAFALGGEVLCAVVHAPFCAETFTAVKGAGAYLNGSPIKASQNAELKSALVATGLPHPRRDVALFLRRLQVVMTHCPEIRRLGAAALDICWVACGRLDAFYESINSWDMAAALLVAREAAARSGHITPQARQAAVPDDLNGQELMVAAPKIFDELLSLLEHAQGHG